MISLITLAVFALPVSGVFAADSSDPFRSQQWYLDTISAPEAWEIHTGSPETIVAVLDAGFDLDHEELMRRYWTNTDEIAGDGIDNDGNGYEDDIQGWDFVESDPDPSSNIDNPTKDSVISHGTVVSGIIAAEAQNGVGIAGINWDVRIMPLRILNENGAGTTSSVRRAVRYAVENGADVINMSLAFDQTDYQLRETLEWAHDQGVVIVSAVGNGEVNTDITPIFPACFDKEIGRNIVIGVAATDSHDVRASFSNYGTGCVDISAPGTNVFGAVYQDDSSILLVTSYGSPWSGTSMAAPMISGAAALLLSAYPTLSPDQVRLSLQLSVDPVAETDLVARSQLGTGRLNIARALEVAARYAGGASVRPANTRDNPSRSFVIAQGQGAVPLVRRYNDHGTLLSEFYAYNEGFRGGVDLAVGDINGDGIEEVITGAGPGGGPQVRVFSIDGRVHTQFFAFDEGERTGIKIAIGDLTGDGADEIVVTRSTGGAGEVRVFDKTGHLIDELYPFETTSTSLALSVGNLDNDAELEIIVTETSGQGRVRVIDGDGRYVRGVSSDQFSGGTLSAVGDLDQDGSNELLVCPARGNRSAVSVYNESGSQTAKQYFFPMSFAGGTQLTIGDIDRNGTTEIFAVPQTSGGPHVRIFDETLNLIGSFFAFESQNRSGASIAIWNP